MAVQKQIVGELLQQIQDKALRGEPMKRYVKTRRSRLAVQIIDPFEGTEVTKILKGDVTDPSVDREEYTISLYTEYDTAWFERANRALIQRGLIVPDTAEVKEMQLVNAVTDDELQEALSKPFLAVKALLDRFTSPAPVERMLRMAREMNKTVGFIEAIENRLAELQAAEYEEIAELDTVIEM